MGDKEQRDGHYKSHKTGLNAELSYVSCVWPWNITYHRQIYFLTWNKDDNISSKGGHTWDALAFHRCPARPCQRHHQLWLLLLDDDDYYYYYCFKPARWLYVTWLLADFEVPCIRLRKKLEILCWNLHLLQIRHLSIVVCLLEDFKLTTSVQYLAGARGFFPLYPFILTMSVIYRHEHVRIEMVHSTQTTNILKLVKSMEIAIT